MALAWAAPVGISVAAPATFFDSAAALRKTSAAVVLQQARKRAATARKDQNDLAGALIELGLLELDFGHATNAYAALEEVRRLLEQDPAPPGARAGRGVGRTGLDLPASNGGQ